MSPWLPETLQGLLDSTPVPTLVALAATGSVLIITACFLLGGEAEVKGKDTTQLSGGSLAKEEVKSYWSKYSTYFHQENGSGASDKPKAPQFVDTFYNLVTDIYEWGWGQSFHFSPHIDGKSAAEQTRLHEERIVDLLRLKPGMKTVDVGCGVGGPMRAIARKSQSKIVGVTINDYQVKRARDHNAKAKLDELCEVVQGNFLEMPFEEASFDAAYSIEATCHAPVLREVYAEVFRVLKPGGLYATYEWVTTHKFDPKNPQHVKIIDEINYGNALVEMRSYIDIVDAAKEAGFEVVENRDLAAPPAGPWYRRLKMGRLAYYRNHILVSIVSFLGIAPKGLLEVHNMLTNVAVWLTKGGETEIFTPAHLLLLRKPAK